MTDEERKAYFRGKMRAWRAANPDKVKGAGQRYYARNKEKCKESALRWRERNPNYSTENSRKWRAANPDKIKCKSLRASGFTLALKNEMLEQQNYKCAICKTPFAEIKTQHLHADHCHKTNTPRGILCRGCNHGLGNYKDDPELLRRAAAYLEEKTNAQCQ